jgi:hypothetical protein
MVAECMLVVSEFHPARDQLANELGPGAEHSARSGMQAKRLAKWEDNALREAVVRGLAAGVTAVSTAPEGPLPARRR